MSVLLLGADYYGTLAAARCLGQRGVKVMVADETRRARALWSRYTKERLVHPPLGDARAFMDWLLEFGQAHPRTVVYPTNDHLAWLLSARREEVSRVFSTMHPDEDTTLSLLDKKRLFSLGSELGIDMPKTWYAETDQDLLSLAQREATFPLLIKPRTQIYLESGIKGSLIGSRDELAGALVRYHALVRFNRVLTDRHPDIDRPMLQAYHKAAETSIFSVSGYVDREHLVSRSAMKILQRPRKIGIGLCFEEREPEQRIIEQLRVLCKHVGYQGAFEAEFIADGERRMLIDFNPRFYSQMAFDVARGLPLPYIVYLVAMGDRAAANAELEEAASWAPEGKQVYCHGFMLDLVLALQGLSGQMPRDEVRRWRAWRKDNEARATDAVRDEGDRLPALIDTASWIEHFARHPRSFFRSYVLNR